MIFNTMNNLLAFLFSVVVLSAANPASNMKLAFSDDFDADKLDETKWAVSGDRTVLSFVKVGKATALRISLLKKEDMIQYNGINTRGKFEQARGYFEASMRMNAYKGHGASMLLRGKDEKVTPFAMAFWEAYGDDKIVPWIRILDDKGQHEMRPENRTRARSRRAKPPRSSIPTASSGPRRASRGSSTASRSIRWIASSSTLR